MNVVFRVGADDLRNGRSGFSGCTDIMGSEGAVDERAGGHAMAFPLRAETTERLFAQARSGFSRSESRRR